MDLARILVVDDDADTLVALRGTLEGRLENSRIETCASGEEALEKLSHHDYDVVLSDIRMPGMNGLALLGRIRASHPILPVLLISGDSTVAGTQVAIKSEAFAFLQKPIDRDQLTILVKRAIEMCRLRKATQQSPSRADRLV